MTSPGATAPDGSFVVGGSDGKFDHWGQNLDMDDLYRMMVGPIIAGIPTLQDALDGFEDILRLMPLNVLQGMQPFFLGTTPAEFATKDLAIATIIGCLKLKEVVLTVEAFQKFLDTMFKPLKDAFDQLIQGLWTILGGVGTGANVTALLALFKKAWDFLSQGFTDLVNGLSKILGGLGTGANVTELIKLFGDGWKFIQDAVTWLNDEVQKVIDQIMALLEGIAKIWNLGAIGDPIKDAINSIAGILGVANNAQSSADFANIGIAAINAANKAGFSDEFNEPLAASLPAATWKATYSGSGHGTWGPNGNGVVVWKPKSGDVMTTPRNVTYVEITHPLPGVPATITLVLAKAPIADLTTRSFFHIDGQANPTDLSCVRYWVGLTTAQFQTVNASGAVTDVGAAVTIPTVKAGDVFELVLDASTAVLKRNGIQAASSPYTPLAGRCVGFGAQVPKYLAPVWDLKWHPAVEFAGIAWHP